MVRVGVSQCPTGGGANVKAPQFIISGLLVYVRMLGLYVGAILYVYCIDMQRLWSVVCTLFQVCIVCVLRTHGLRYSGLFT